MRSDLQSKPLLPQTVAHVFGNANMRVIPWITPTSVASALGFTLLRMCAVFCILFTIGVGNVWGADATMAGGTTATASTFSSASGYKCGSKSYGGSMTVTIPAGATVLSVYIAAGFGDSNVSVSISRSSGTISSSSVSPASDSGISGNGSSYTLANAESTYLQTFTLSSVNSQTTVTFSTSSGKNRFGVWGAKICYSPTSPTNTTIGSTTATLGWSDAKNVNSYEVYYSTSSTAPTASSSGTTTTSKSINLTSLTSSQQYYWWVRAYDSYCKSAWVAGSSFTTTSGASCAAPNAPTNSSVSGTGVTTTSAAANYDIYLSTSSTTPTTEDPSATISSGNSKAITGLNYGTTYYYWMRQNCGGGSTSSCVAGSPATFTTTVPAPTGLSMTPSLNGVTFGITDANNVNSYEIYYSTTNSEPGASPSGTATTTTKSKEVTGLPASTTYYCWVRATGPNANSSWYSAGSFATLTLSSISVSTAPDKVKYLVGDNFDPTALIITRTYSNSTSDTYTYSGHTSEFTFSPATNAALTAENTSVTISYGGKSTSQAINVYTVTVNKVNMSGTAITNASVTATCSGRTLSQSVSTTNYKFNSWNVTAGGVTVSTNTITGTPTGNVTINAKFHDPITVTWKVGNGAASGGTGEVKYGAAITALPSTPADNALASCGTNKFMGWSASELTGTGHSAPADLFTTIGGATNLTTNTTYRAVFANQTSGYINTTVVEDFEKQSTSTTYNSTQRYSEANSNASIGWVMYYGTNSTDVVLEGSRSAQMRWYSSATSNYPYIQDTTKLLSLSKLKFRAKVSNTNVKMDVSYSTDNGSSWTKVANGASLTTTETEYSYDIPGADATKYIINIGVNSSSTAPSSGNYKFTVDSVAFTYKVPGTVTSDYQTGCCSAPGTALSITSANSVATGGTVSLTSTGGNGGTVTWSVVNGSGTATVAGTTLTAGSIGTVTVKAHQDANTVLGTEYCAQDAEQAFAVVSSTVNVTGVEVSPTSKAIVPGETFTITPTISPSNATDKSVSWTSSASDKASVSSGTVTGVAAGTATITCTTTDGSYTATTAVTVYGVTLQALDEDGNAIAVGGPGTPSRTGASISPAADAGNYVFKEWAISGASLGSSASTKANTITNPTGAVTVTAKYYKPRTVKWSVNGNDSYNTGGPTTTVAYNGTISAVPTDPSGLACASSFIAWTDAAHNNGQTAKDNASYYGSALYTVAGDFPNITAETTTFYAVFAERSNSDGYKYIGDDGTLSDGEKYIFIDSKTTGSAHALKASDLPLNNAAGKRGTAVSVTITTTAEGTLITTINTDLEFTYASTGTKLVISGSNYLYVNGNGVGYKVSSSRSTYGTHTLYGWTDGSSNRYVYYDSSNGNFTISEDSKNMYAFKKQTPEYSNYVTECDANIVRVTYNANGGATTCAGGSHDKTTDYTVCATEPTRDYYDFAGWLCSADGVTYNAGATIDDAAIDADFTLTAQWTPVPYNITYELDGGTNNVGNPATYNVTTATITLQDPTRDHDRFDGWYKTYSAGVYSDPVTSIPLGSHGDITLYAKWAARHEIIFDYSEGDGGTTTTIYRADDENLEDAVAGMGSVPDNPDAPSACSSKVFVGWSESEIDDETDTEPADLFNGTGAVNEDKHYYAVWAVEHSGSGQVTVFEDAFYGKANSDATVSSYGKWTLSTVLGTGTSSEGVRLSSGSSGASMTLDLSDKTLESTITIKFKMKKYGSKDDGTVTFDCLDEGATPTFTPSTFNDPTTSWVEKTCTVTGVDNKVKSITILGAKDKQVYFKDLIITQTGTVYTYDGYAISCCATKVTLSENSPEHGTIAFGKTSVGTCGGDKNVSLTITPAAGYQLSSYEVATGSGKITTTSVSPDIALNNNSSAAQNITLTFAEDANGTYDVTAAFSLMTVTGWTWTLNSEAIPNPLNLYVGQSARLDVAYTPAGVDASKKTYTRTKVDAYINWSPGANQPNYCNVIGRASTGESTTAVTFTHADGPTTTVNVKVLPLPLVHFTDNVHNVVFADVAGTIEANALVKDKTTPTTSDFSGTTYNTCEEQHEHLVGWIESSWADEHPEATHSEIAGAGAGVFYTAGASIDVEVQNGKTFYAVWSKIE